MPKHLLNSSKPTFKSPKNNFFGPKNGQIMGTNFGNFGKSVDFLVYYGPKTSNIDSKVLKLIIVLFNRQ